MIHQDYFSRILSDEQISKVSGGLSWRNLATGVLVATTAAAATIFVIGYKANKHGYLDIIKFKLGLKDPEFGGNITDLPSALPDHGFLLETLVSQEKQPFWDGHTCGAHATKNLLLAVGHEVGTATQLYNSIRRNTQEIAEHQQAEQVALEPDLNQPCCQKKFDERNAYYMKVTLNFNGERRNAILGAQEIQAYLRNQGIETKAFSRAPGPSDSAINSTVANLIGNMNGKPVILNLGGSHWVDVMGYQHYPDGHVDLFVKDSCRAAVTGRSYNRVFRVRSTDMLAGFLCFVGQS